MNFKCEKAFDRLSLFRFVTLMNPAQQTGYVEVPQLGAIQNTGSGVLSPRNSTRTAGAYYAPSYYDAYTITYPSNCPYHPQTIYTRSPTHNNNHSNFYYPGGSYPGGSYRPVNVTPGFTD